MATWRKVNLGDGIMASTPCAEIKEQFAALFAVGEMPADAAVFTYSTMQGVHCEITVYFSPTVDQFAGAFGASSCAVPKRDGLELLAGSPGCWAALFPLRHS